MPTEPSLLRLSSIAAVFQAALGIAFGKSRSGHGLRRLPAGCCSGQAPSVPDAIRNEVGEALGEESSDRWLTIVFTTDPEWAE
jgi:predicted Co/Zn/Cd cation transporter (cation efflux family)